MQYKSLFIVLIATLTLVGAGCTPDQDTVSSMNKNTAQDALPFDVTQVDIENKIVRISTAKGDIVFELYDASAPVTVTNFLYLVQTAYYNGLTFHRREEGFVIQGGDPNGNGTGGPGYAFRDELDDEFTYNRGIVAMANRGPNTNGSQFFIMLADTPLPKAYTIFGRVIEGMDVVDQIEVGDMMEQVTIESAKEMVSEE